MSLLFPCSGCGKTISVSEAAAGKQVRCPQCKAVTQALPAGSDSPEKANPYTSDLHRSTARASENPYVQPIAQALNLPLQSGEFFDIPTHPINYIGPGAILLVQAGLSVAIHLWMILESSLSGLTNPSVIQIWLLCSLIYQGLVSFGAISLIRRRRLSAARLGAILALVPISFLTSGFFVCGGLLTYPLALIGGMWALSTLNIERAREASKYANLMRQQELLETLEK
jgi:phage FluMu protein Com